MALIVRRASYERRHGGRLTIGWVGVIRLVNGYRVGQPETATAATQTRVQTATMSYQRAVRRRLVPELTEAAHKAHYWAHKGRDVLSCVPRIGGGRGNADRRREGSSRADSGGATVSVARRVAGV